MLEGKSQSGLTNLPERQRLGARVEKHYGAMHFGIGHGADRHQVNSKLRLEGIVDRVTVVVDDNKIVCEKGQIKV